MKPTPSTPPRPPVSVSGRAARPAVRPTGLALAAACAAALLQACGSGDDDSPPPPAPAQISGVVADGPLQGATACYDLNDNGACDSGEPSATTDADGKYSFSVEASVAGKHAVVAQVPATAIDKDTSAAIGAALVLVAPPSGSGGAQAVFVSPLTTVVAHTAADNGSTVAEATARVQAQLELTVSPLADFTAAGANADLGTAARSVGKVMVDTARLAADAGVNPVQAAKLVREAATTQLPVLATALQASAGAGATLAQRIAAAARAVSTQLNLSPSTVTQVAAAVSQPTVAGDAAGPFVSVRRFTYTDAGNYSYQLFTGDSSQTDASGAWLAHEPRANVVNGEAIPFSRNQLYWTGSAWNNCDNGHAVVTSIAGTATTPQKSLYCGGQRTESRTVWEDISGKTLREVITRMRAYPLPDRPGSTTNASGLPVLWGPDPALLPADAVFPAGSRYVTRKATSDIGSTERIETAVRPRVRHADGVFRQARTLDDLSLMGGNLVAADTVVTDQNALFVEDVPLDSQPDNTLQAVKRWRLAVDVAALKGRFHRCDAVIAGNGSRNCEVMGDATLAVTTQGGIRLLRVASGYPVELKDRMQRQRFWAEHMGTVFRGTTEFERSYNEQRLNKPGWDAVRTALGIPEQVTPPAPVTAGAFNILRGFSFTDAANFSWRKLGGDTSVLDADGNYTISESRRTVSGGADQPFSRNRTFWSGTAWVACPDSGPIARNKAVAPFTSVYCGYTDERTAGLTVSLAGRLMRDVLVDDIRSYYQTDGGVSYGSWPNPNVHTQLASVRFPAGATMDLRGLQLTVTPEGIATAATDQLRVAPSPNTSVPFANWPFATSLEDVIARYPGDLLGSTSVNGSVALFVHRYTQTPTDAAYTNEMQIRVAFDANGNKARFFRNNIAVSTGFTTNYVQLLDTTYTIETLGSVRLLKFAALPDEFVTRFGYERRFAERDGGVWYAFKDRLPSTPNWSIRLNATATDALFGALGVQ